MDDEIKLPAIDINNDMVICPKCVHQFIAIPVNVQSCLATERKRRDAAEGLLRELRARLHSAGRRPEECWEMSEIDAYFSCYKGV